MGAVHVTSQLKELRGDTRRFTATIADAATEGTATWDEGGDFPNDDFEVVSLTLEKSAGASFSQFGVKPSSKTASGFDVECDSPPGSGETYTYHGLAVRN